MFDALVASGEALSARLEGNVRLGEPGSPHHQPGEIVSFSEINAWYSDALGAVARTLGADPKARLEYMWQLFEDEWHSTNRATSASLEKLRGLLYLLRAFSARLDPVGAEAGFDWAKAPDANELFPVLPEIEAKRSEFFRAMLQDAKDHVPGSFDPLSSAKRIGLHERHAREFFVSLVRSGHVNREWLTRDWRQRAEEIDDEGQSRGAAVVTAAARPLSVFLCHASEDKGAVRDLSGMLRKWGHDPWLDEDRLLPGQDWDREIRRAIERADVVLICLSERSEKRGYVQKEIKRALDVAEEQPEGAVFVIPVKLTNCSVPDRLRSAQWVDFFAASGPSKLEAALRLRATTAG